MVTQSVINSVDSDEFNRGVAMQSMVNSVGSDEFNWGVVTQSVINSIGSDEFNRGVAQLVAYYVRDVGAGSSSLLTPTIKIK